jgi:hypothetical protein
MSYSSVDASVKYVAVLLVWINNYKLGGKQTNKKE